MKSSLRTLLLGLTSVAILVVMLGGLAFNLRDRIDTTGRRLAAQTERLAAAGAPLLLNSLVVGDLAIAEQTLRNLNADLVWDQVKLYESNGRRLMLDASPAPPSQSKAPPWLKRLLSLDLQEFRIQIAADPVVYGVLAVTPSSRHLESELWGETRATVTVTGVLLAALLALMTLILDYGLRPVRALGQSATRLGSGDFAARMPTTTLAEMAPTVRAFNAMAENLERVLGELQAKEAANRRLAEIVEQAGEAIVTIDLEHRITSWNHGAERQLGHPAAQMVGQSIAGLFAAATAADRDQQTERLIETRPPGRLEAALLRSSGVPLLVSASSSPLSDEAGAHVGYIVVARDITERKRAEEVREDLEEQLRQAHKIEAIGRLAGGVAHDFNNLLSVILGRAEMLRARLGPNDPLGRHVDLIRQSSQRAASLTRQLLAFSRKQLLQPQMLDLTTVMVGLVPMLRRLIPENIEILTTPGPDLGQVKVDRGQIEQVILNLAVNARDAMLHGGRLGLATVNADLDEAFARRHPGLPPGPYVALEVKDTGAGMDAATQSHLFEPYFTTKELGRGTGLGLATVYGIVKQSDGYITVDSAPGRGTTFTIYLPRVTEAAGGPEPTPVPGRSSRGSETILLVEDDEGVRDLLREALETSGYSVLAAGDAREALGIVDRHADPIDLMVTDVVMPQMSGRQLAEQLASARPSTKVLYVSGYTHDAIVHHGVLDPGITLLQKPFTPERLALKVREILDAPSPAAPAGASERAG